jgi:16S rRNA processing protein RimM
MDFEIGKIANTHGLKGDVKVFPTTEDVQRFSLLVSKEVFVINKDVPKKYTIQNVKYHKNMAILKFKEIDTIEQAELLKNATIKIPKELALPLAEGEFYLKDIYDMEVTTDEGEYLGVIVDIMQTGANDVYVVEKDGDKKTQILIPSIKQCILDLDIENKKMKVHLLKGLR